MMPHLKPNLRKSGLYYEKLLESDFIRQGYHIIKVDPQYKLAQIDIIAVGKQKVFFVEVKSSHVSLEHCLINLKRKQTLRQRKAIQNILELYDFHHYEINHLLAAYFHKWNFFTLNHFK